MFDVREFESRRDDPLIEDRNEKPLWTACFAIIVVWTIAIVIAVA